MTSPRIEEPTGVVIAHQPHHDAGPLFSPRPPARLGDTALLRLWVPAAYPLRGAALRASIDGEIWTALLHPERESASPDHDGASPEGESAGEGAWWSVELVAANPVVPYRFCLIAEEGACTPDGTPVPSYAWLTAAGLFPWDVSDAGDFRLSVHEPAPDWVDDAVVYQIFPDRFARSSAAPLDADGRPAPEDLPDWAVPMRWDEEPAVRGTITGRQLYGGDLDGVIERLDHIAQLGADTVYLTPVFPAGSVHRYDASTFEEVDPLLGGDEALARLAGALHERGMRLILDLTTNHTGDTHEWFARAQADALSPEAGFYLFTEHPGSYEAWLQVPTLPKLDQRSALLRSRLTDGPGSVVGRYLQEPFDADGWRIDVANMTGRHADVDLARDVAREIRATMRESDAATGRDTWLIAEHGHDATGDLAGDGWHGTMNYTGFTRPIWAWLADPDSGLNWLGLPMTIPSLPGDAIVRTLREYNAQMPWPSRLHSQNQLASHDTPRARTVVGTREKHLVALAALATMPGVPTLFAGEELGAEGLTGEHARTPMPWTAITERDEDLVDVATMDATAALLGLRREQIALRRGGMRWLHASTDALVYVRTHPQGDTLVHLARAAHAPIELDLAVIPEAGAPEVLLRLGEPDAATAAETSGRTLRLTARGAGASILRVPRRP